MDKNKKTKKTVADTICRVHRSGGYAVLSNCFVRSTNIGCDGLAYVSYKRKWNIRTTIGAHV